MRIDMPVTFRIEISKLPGVPLTINVLAKNILKTSKELGNFE